MPHITIFGPAARPSAEDDRETKLVKEWAKYGHKPDLETARAIRNRMVNWERWRETLICELKALTEQFQSLQHTDPLNLPAKRSEEYQAGRAAGRFEALNLANRMVVDVVNRAGMAEEVLGEESE